MSAALAKQRLRRLAVAFAGFLEAHAGALVVFDNVEDPPALRDPAHAVVPAAWPPPHADQERLPACNEHVRTVRSRRSVREVCGMNRQFSLTDWSEDAVVRGGST